MFANSPEAFESFLISASKTVINQWLAARGASG